MKRTVRFGWLVLVMGYYGTPAMNMSHGAGGIVEINGHDYALEDIKLFFQNNKGTIPETLITKLRDELHSIRAPIQKLCSKQNNLIKQLGMIGLSYRHEHEFNDVCALLDTYLETIYERSFDHNTIQNFLDTLYEHVGYLTRLALGLHADIERLKQRKENAE